MILKKLKTFSKKILREDAELRASFVEVQGVFFAKRSRNVRFGWSARPIRRPRKAGDVAHSHARE